MDKVRCPYCGAEMGYYENNMNGIFMNGFFTAYFCLKCGSVAPKIAVDVGLPDAAEMKAAAYAAAMQRWQEPNRVLTLEEILALDPNGATCVESRRGEIEAQLNSELKNEANATVEDYGIDNARKMYGKYARAWLRRPTDEERAGAGWDLNHGEESENG